MPQAILTAPDTDGGTDFVNLAELGRALRRQWRWVAIPVVMACAGSFIYVNLATPRYTSDAKLLLESRDNIFTRPIQDRDGQAPLIDEQAVASQVQVMTSRDVVLAAIRRLDLVGNPEFDPGVRPRGVADLLSALVGHARGPAAAPPPEERIARVFYDRLSVNPVARSRVVAVEFQSRDPDLAARAANAVAESYLESLEAAKKDTARSASSWLLGNIETLRERVAEAERKAADFRSRSGLLMGANNTPISQQQFAEINTQLTQARAAKADAEARAQVIKDNLRAGRVFEIPEVANNDLVRRLIEQRVSLRTQLALESRTLLPGHPRIKELEAQLRDLDTQVRAAAERTVRTLEADARVAGSRVETLQGALAAQTRIVSRANEDEVQLRELEREAKSQRDQLEVFLARYRDAVARDAEAAAPPDARIVSRAAPAQTPTFPKKLPIVILVTLSAAIFAAGAIVARELLGGGAPPRRLTVPPPPGDDAAALPVPVREAPEPSEDGAGNLPATPAAVTAVAATKVAVGEVAATKVAAATEVAGATEAVALATSPALDGRFDLDALIARLERSEPDRRGRRVLLVGLEEGAKTSDLAQALGLELARAARAIRVDLDGGGVPAKDAGFTDLVSGDADFGHVIRREPGSRLHRVGAGTLEGALLAGEWERLDLALSAFDATYDWLVAILHDMRDERLLGLVVPRVDCVVIVSEEEPASEPLVTLYERMQALGAADVVVVHETEAPEARAA